MKSAQGLSGDDCYNLGCIYARAAAAVRKDASVACDQRTKLVESHVSDSLRWLKSAYEAGTFRDSASRDYAKKDRDL